MILAISSSCMELLSSYDFSYSVSYMEQSFSILLAIASSCMELLSSYDLSYSVSYMEQLLAHLQNY